MELSEQLVVLVDELLDAHDDTLRLSQDMVLDDRWEAHLSYLSDLRRLGGEALTARLLSCHAPRRAGSRRPIQSSLTRRRRCGHDGPGEGSA